VASRYDPASGVLSAPRECRHEWQPISMVFETQLLDQDGRVLVRQPDLDEGRIYLVCLGCASHTYVTTSWIGFRLIGSEDANPRFRAAADGDGVEVVPNRPDGYNRPGVGLDPEGGG
jgi:hypothetical protein